MNRDIVGPRPLALVDTSAWYALADVSETRHSKAVAIRERLTRERWRLVITNYLVAETHALLLIRRGYLPALRFLETLARSPTTVVRVTEDDERRAMEIIHTYDDKSFSLTDATSFAVMERLGITIAFTFDRNFSQYGFLILATEQQGRKRGPGHRPRCRIAASLSAQG